MTRFKLHYAGIVLALGLATLPVDTARAKGKEKTPKVDTKEVHETIKKGREFLLNQFADGIHVEKWHDTGELVMLTLAHAKVDRTHKVFKDGITALKKSELRTTYRVACMAMALSEINPFAHREKLAHCAQWLVDMQQADGSWGYPGHIKGPKDRPLAETVKPPEMPESHKQPVIILRRRSSSEALPTPRGDFSNTQFAILGLRACLAARIQIPKETWQDALKYTLASQRKDGGWGYIIGKEQDMASYASLTCAGACGAAICLYQLGKKSPKSNGNVKKALKWLNEHWDESNNVGMNESSIIGPSSWQYYHLYSLERVGRVLGLKKVGKRPWFDVGARWIMDQQRGDGSWRDPGADSRTPKYMRIADTCFAILFLTLSTPPLTGG